MGTLACILVLIKIRKKHKGLSIILIIVIICLLTIIIRNVYIFDKMRDKEWINILEFSNSINIEKEGKISSYPEIIVLSEMDGEIITLNIDEGDIVNKWDILAQIGNKNNGNEIINIENQIEEKYDELYKKMKEYDEFENQYNKEISDLEKKLYEHNIIIQIAKDMDDTNTKAITQKEIQEINSQLTDLKQEKSDLKSEILNIRDEIQSSTQKSTDIYNEINKQTPRASIQGIIGNMYVHEGDKIKNGDKICTIINNSSTPEINVSLDFNEYVLTKDLTGVIITTENENRGNSYYKGEVYTRSPILNEQGEYTVTVKIIEDDIPDLILSDENTKITVFFTIESTSIWIPSNCFNKLGKSSGVLTLRDGKLIEKKEIGIKSKWNGWINVEEFTTYSLEKEEKKDGIDSEVSCRIE